MRVLHVTQGYAPAVGGTELLIQRVSEQLHGHFGDDVTVYTTNCLNGEAFFTPSLPALPVGWDRVGGLPVRRFAVRRRWSHFWRGPQAVAWRLGLPGHETLRNWAGGPVVPGLRAAIRDHKADVVMASSFPLLHMFDTLHGGRASGARVVLHGGLHPHDRWGFERRGIYEAIRAADAYIANTSWEADYVLARGASADRVHAVGVGVDMAPYEGLTTRDARFRLGLPPGPVVGFIGQIAAHKGVDALLQAMPDVWKAHPDTTLIIAGGRTLFTPHVEATVASWPPQWRGRTRVWVDFPSSRKALLFAALDLLAYPSGYESFGIAFLEAWAAGKPVIGTTNGAIPAVVADGETGLLVPYQDAGALAHAIRQLLDQPAAAAALGAEGRARTLARYTWPHIAARFREIYTAVLARG